MLLNFGGPVWHASGNSRMQFPQRMADKLSRSVQEQHSMHIALSALRGVGDAELGEWTEEGNPGPGGVTIWHVRRRLSIKEQFEAGLDVIDMRNTEKGSERLRWLFQQHPHLKAYARTIGEAT
jgi:hypothetical protein